MYEKQTLNKKIKNRSVTSNLSGSRVNQEALAKVLLDLFIKSCGEKNEEKRNVIAS